MATAANKSKKKNKKSKKKYISCDKSNDLYLGIDKDLHLGSDDSAYFSIPKGNAQYSNKDSRLIRNTCEYKLYGDKPEGLCRGRFNDKHEDMLRCVRAKHLHHLMTTKDVFKEDHSRCDITREISNMQIDTSSRRKDIRYMEKMVVEIEITVQNVWEIKSLECESINFIVAKYIMPSVCVFNIEKVKDPVLLFRESVVDGNIDIKRIYWNDVSKVISKADGENIFKITECDITRDLY